MFCSKPQFWKCHRNVNNLLLRKAGARGGGWLLSFRHIYQALKRNRMGEKICQSHAGEKEKERRRLTDREAEGDRQRQRSAWIAGRPCQSHGADGTRDLIGCDRGWCILLISGIIKHIVQFVLSLGSSTESSISMLDDVGSAFFLVAQRSVIMHKNTNTHTHTDSSPLRINCSDQVTSHCKASASVSSGGKMTCGTLNRQMSTVCVCDHECIVSHMNEIIHLNMNTKWSTDRDDVARTVFLCLCVCVCQIGFLW